MRRKIIRKLLKLRTASIPSNPINMPTSIMHSKALSRPLRRLSSSKTANKRPY